MFPLPTLRAKFAFAACVALYGAGLLAQVTWLLLFATGGAVGLSLCLAATVPSAKRMRGVGLSFGWSTRAGRQHRGIPLCIGRPLALQGYVQYQGTAPLRLYALRPALGPGLLLHRVPPCIAVNGVQRCDFPIEIEGRAAGRWLVHGLSAAVPGPLGLFLAPLYFPTPLPVRVLPKITGGRAQAHLGGLLHGATVAPRGPNFKAGQGAEFRELRQLVPGDSYRSIAWKASARRGKLLVREVDDDPQAGWLVILDGSEDMCRGALGQQPLDSALAVALTLVQQRLAYGDPVGLVTVHHRVLKRLAPERSPVQLTRVQDALLELRAPVDSDLTAADSKQVQQAVARYLRRQDGLHKSQHQVTTLAHVVMHAQHALRDTGSESGVRGVAPEDALLRRFCRHRGIRLPLRQLAPGSGPGLQEALRWAVHLRPKPSHLLLLLTPTELAAQLTPSGDLQARIRDCRAQGVRVVCGLAKALNRPAHEVVEGDASGLEGGSEVAAAQSYFRARRTERDVVARLRRLGIEHLSIDGGSASSLVVEQFVAGTPHRAGQWSNTR